MRTWTYCSKSSAGRRGYPHSGDANPVWAGRHRCAGLYRASAICWQGAGELHHRAGGLGFRGVPLITILRRMVANLGDRGGGGDGAGCWATFVRYRDGGRTEAKLRTCWSEPGDRSRSGIRAEGLGVHRGPVCGAAGPGGDGDVRRSCWLTVDTFCMAQCCGLTAAAPVTEAV